MKYTEGAIRLANIVVLIGPNEVSQAILLGKFPQGIHANICDEPNGVAVICGEAACEVAIRAIREGGSNTISVTLEKPRDIEAGALWLIIDPRSITPVASVKHQLELVERVG